MIHHIALRSSFSDRRGLNALIYRVVFEAGDLNATIDEAGLGNNATEASGDNLAYAEVTPNAIVSASDTLQVDWEITPLGA